MTPGPGWRSASWGPDTQTQGFSLKVKVLISPAPAQHRVKCPTVIASAIHQMCDVFNLISLTLISAARPPGAKTDQDELRVIRHLRCPGVRMTSGAARKSKYSIETSGTRDQTPWPQSHPDTCYRKWFAQRLRVIFIGVEHFGFRSWLLSRDSEINNWSEPHSMAPVIKHLQRERLKTAMWNNFFLIEWSRVHHQYHFLLLLLWHRSPAHLVPVSEHHSGSSSGGLIVIIIISL